jgi:hypothetical protein
VGSNPATPTAGNARSGSVLRQGMPALNAFLAPSGEQTGSRARNFTPRSRRGCPQQPIQDADRETGNQRPPRRQGRSPQHREPIKAPHKRSATEPRPRREAEPDVQTIDTLPAMLRDAFAGLVAAGPSGWLVYQALAPSRAIWRGDASRVPELVRIRPKARSYLAFLLWVVPVFSGTCLIGLALLATAILGQTDTILAFATPAIPLVLGGLPFTLVYAFVSAFNRPRFLVPPAYRHQQGWVAQARRRRQHKRNGHPPTATS